MNDIFQNKEKVIKLIFPHHSNSTSHYLYIHQLVSSLQNPTVHSTRPPSPLRLPITVFPNFLMYTEKCILSIHVSHFPSYTFALHTLHNSNPFFDTTLGQELPQLELTYTNSTLPNKLGISVNDKHGVCFTCSNYQ